MSAEENKAIVRRLVQEVSQGNAAVLDAHPGLEEVKSMLLQGPPLCIAEMIAEGDWVATRMITGSESDTDGFEVLNLYQFTDGVIVKQHAQGGQRGVQDPPLPTP